MFKALKSHFSVNYSPVTLVDMSSVDFQSYTFWGLVKVLEVSSLRSWCAFRRVQTLWSSGRISRCWVHSQLWVALWFMVRLSLNLSYLLQCGFFRLFVCLPEMSRNHSASFSVFLRRKCSICSYKFGVPVGGRARFSFVTILNQNSICLDSSQNLYVFI